MLVKRWVFVLVILHLCSCSKIAENKIKIIKRGWKMVYQNDYQGDSIYGSKKLLVESIKMGLPIRCNISYLDNNSQEIELFVEPNYVVTIGYDIIISEFFLQSYFSEVSTNNLIPHCETGEASKIGWFVKYPDEQVKNPIRFE